MINQNWVSVKIDNLKILDQFTDQLFNIISAHCIILLIGPLGSGKTTLTQLLLKRLLIRESVTSPTFTILKQYQGVWYHQLVTINHFDFYRLRQQAHPDDWLMISNYFYSGINIIEWPKIDINYQKYCSKVIEIHFQINNQQSRILKWRYWHARN